MQMMHFFPYQTKTVCSEANALLKIRSCFAVHQAHCSKSKYPLSSLYNHSLSLNQPLWRHEGKGLSLWDSPSRKASFLCSCISRGDLFSNNFFFKLKAFPAALLHPLFMVKLAKAQKRMECHIPSQRGLTSLSSVLSQQQKIQSWHGK